VALSDNRGEMMVTVLVRTLLTSSDGSRLPVDPGLFLTVPDEPPAQATLMIRIDKDSELPAQAALGHEASQQ